jgi:hypothetical protein
VQFTAAAMLLLEQQGKLSIQDPICTYLDDCPDAWKPITIHHLLSHTSGLGDSFEGSPSEAFKLSREGATVEQIVALFRDKPLLFAPGERRYWSHAAFSFSILRKRSSVPRSASCIIKLHPRVSAQAFIQAFTLGCQFFVTHHLSFHPCRRTKRYIRSSAVSMCSMLAA